MKTFGIISIPFLVFAAGRLAFAGDASAAVGAAGLDWHFIITNYGLMPLVAGALYWLIHQRDKQIFALLDKHDAALKERIAEGKETVAAMTKMTATLDNLCVESEKTRVTAYQLRDMTIKQSDAVWEPEVRGNTRIMRKDG